MIVPELIPTDVLQLIDGLLRYRFPYFLKTMDAFVSEGNDVLIAADITTEEELRDAYQFGCYLYAQGFELDPALYSPDNPFGYYATEAGWMGMQDSQFRGGQVLPGDNQYE